MSTKANSKSTNPNVIHTNHDLSKPITRTFIESLGLNIGEEELENMSKLLDDDYNDHLKVTEDEKRFCDLLTACERNGTEDLLKYLKHLDFFRSPASVNHHDNCKYGLVRHSLNTYDCAMNIREEMLKKNPEFEDDLPLDSITIASLLHDVCKADEYGMENGKPTRRQQFPIGGHGDKSLIYILRTGFTLSLIEMLAIKWHMGSSRITDKREKAICEQAKVYPLVRLIIMADYEASNGD